jgi:uncharacterized membrane protein YfcA
MVPTMSVPALAAALIVTFLAATIQGVVGMGFAMVSVPILALVDPSLAPVPQLLVTLPLTLSMAWKERHHIRFPAIGWIIAGRVPGAVVGLALLTVATGQFLDLVIAAVVIGAVAIIASGLHVRRTHASEFGAGVLSGASSLIASIGGPPLALLYSSDDGPTIRSNLAAVFSVGLVITVTARSLSGNITASDLKVAIIIFPALVAGYVVSLRFKDRVSQPMVKFGVLAISLIGAVGLIVRTLL